MISKAGDKLWKELVGPEAVSLNIRYISLAFTGVEDTGIGQQNIEGFFKPRSGNHGEAASGQKRKRRSSSPSDLHRNLRAPLDASGASSLDGWRCPRCGYAVNLPNDEKIDQTDMEFAYNRYRTMHEDEHMAQDLAKEFGTSQHARPESRKPTSARKGKKKDDDGLFKFFRRT